MNQPSIETAEIKFSMNQLSTKSVEIKLSAPAIDQDGQDQVSVIQTAEIKFSMN